MRNVFRNSWDRLGIQRKVWVVLLVVVIPMVAILSIHATLIRSLLTTQQTRHHALLAREQTQELRRIAIDIEDAFRGYLLTENHAFLAPLRDADWRLKDSLARAEGLLATIPGVPGNLTGIGGRIVELLGSKHRLLEQVERGGREDVLRYVQSGEGLRLSDQVRSELREIEDRLDRQIERLEREASALSTRSFWGLLAAVGVGLVLGGFGVRMLARSVTGPVHAIQTSLERFAQGQGEDARGQLAQVNSADELGQLARSCEDMTAQIGTYIRELKVLHEVGLDITTIGPDGLDGVLKRLVDHAAVLLRADVCLVLNRNEQMGCWIVEAATGAQHDQLKRTVMLWEELPLSVRAYETARPTIGERLRDDTRPELMRRNLIGDSMLVVPLLSQGKPFGVMALLTERTVAVTEWNIPAAENLAGVAAVALSNVRLYDAAHQKEQRTSLRLRQLEHLAEMLAHDLKGPAERMQGLATILRDSWNAAGQERSEKLLSLIEQNGRELTGRVEHLLALAEVGGRHESLEAVDPTLVLDDVLKARAIELDHVRITRMAGLPSVACHRAYLYQIFDNLISNAVKFIGACAHPRIVISASIDGPRAIFMVADNGPGIPAAQRDRVFDPFVRLNPSPAGPKGSGIGLAIVRRIVELYGGRVWIEPSDSGGCRVCFTMPLLGHIGPAGAQEDALQGSPEEPGGERL